MQLMNIIDLEPQNINWADSMLQNHNGDITWESGFLSVKQCIRDFLFAPHVKDGTYIELEDFEPMLRSGKQISVCGYYDAEEGCIMEELSNLFQLCKSKYSKKRYAVALLNGGIDIHVASEVGREINRCFGKKTRLIIGFFPGLEGEILDKERKKCSVTVLMA